MIIVLPCLVNSCKDVAPILKLISQRRLQKNVATMSLLESECRKAFRDGNKQDAERLLPLITRPADIRTKKTFYYLWNSEEVSLLHLATHHGWINIIINLITKYKCDTNCKDSHGRTPLHYAAKKNHLEMVRYFINEQQCDPMTRDNDGDTPLHLACHYGHLGIAQYLISEAHCNPSCENKNGDTPLHLACHYGYLNTTMYLISEAHCNPSCENKNGDTPLHLACHYGHLNITKYLISEAHCNPSCENKNGETPLHLACHYGHLDITKYFISEAHCNPSCENKNGDTPLHLACNHSHAHIVQHLLFNGKVNPLARNRSDKTPLFKLTYFSRLPLLHLAARHGWMDIIIKLILITKYKCDNNCKDSNGCTPLHYAAINNHLEVVRYFINEQHCDPMTRDNDGDTPLHNACIYDNPQIAQFLLTTGKVDPLAKNNVGKSPLDYASRHGYDLLKQFQSFIECERDFPVHTYTKLILTGYSGAGKTTISQLIFLLASKPETGFFSWLSSGCVTDVECLTAGIITLHVESEVNELGNMVIYDFAGQQEYYSSHGAVLERIMSNSAAIFVCIVDLSQCIDKISESIHYWISFIENACSSAQGSSHIIIVGSHADLVKSPQELIEKKSLVESIAESRPKQLTYGGFVSMDCRLSKSIKARHFRSLLSTSQQAILSSQPSMSLYCHVLYAFLRTKLMKVGCTLQELTTALASENDPSYKSSLLTESLTSLSDKGLILFVQNQEHPQSSWVVVKKDALLREVNGTLFAPDHFKQYHQIASNTGIVPITTLEEFFPEYSSEMLVGCLESMEFCHPVDLSTLQATNLKATSSPSSPGAEHLFFPNLVKDHRPMVISPPQSLAGVWGAVTLTNSSAIVSYMFFSFDLHLHFL